MKNMFIVTITGSSPAFPKGEQAWSLANHCARVGDNAFLLDDEIALHDVYAKFLSLVSNNGRVSVFPVTFPFCYQGTDMVHDNIQRLFGEKSERV